MSAPAPDTDHAADRRVIRRAVKAGGVVTGLISVIGIIWVAMSGAHGALGLAAVLAGLTLGALTAAAWLLLSVVVDLLAGRSPGARRLWLGLGLAVLAFLSPVLLLGALSAAGS